MNLLDFIIFFTIIYNLALFGALLVLILYIFCYILNLNNIEFRYLIIILSFITINFVSYLILPYFLIVVFYLIMYIFYIIIKTIIPETGFPTLFIPVRELLMKIPPLQAFEDRGIFKLLSSLFKFIGGSSSFSDRLKGFLYDYYLFSKENTLYLIKLFNPHVSTEKFSTIIENMNNNNKKSELNNINNDIEVCIGNSTKFTTPDMNYTNIFMNDISNIKNNFKCNLKTIPAYIAT
jgi:hypothetical protein